MGQISPRSPAQYVKRKTEKSRLRRSIKATYAWCKCHRHKSIPEQHKTLCQKLHGHYGYFGITGNFSSLAKYYYVVRRAWKKWLHRRNPRARLRWDRFQRILDRYPLPKPRVTQSVYRT